MEKSKKLKPCKSEIIIYFLTTYSLTIMLLDKYLDDLPKFIFILLIIFGTILFMNKSLKVLGAKYLIIFFFYYIFILINGIFFNNTARLVRGVYEYIFYSLIFFATIYYISEVKINNLLKYISYIGTIISILSVYEYKAKLLILGVEGKNIGYFTGGEIIVRSRVFSDSFLTHAMLLSILAIINLYLFLIEKRYYYILAMISNIFGELSTSSRGPLVALVVGMFVLYSIYNYFFIDKKKTMYIKIIISCILSIVIVISIVIIFNTNFSTDNKTLNYFLQRIRLIFDWENEGANVQRKMVWNYYITMFKDNIFSGIGIAATGSKDVGIVSMRPTESGVLKRFVELGIIGAIIHYCIVMSIIFKGMLNIGKVSKSNRYIAILAISVIIAILVEDFVLQITESIMISFFMWFFLAILFVKTNVKEDVN